MAEKTQLVAAASSVGGQGKSIALQDGAIITTARSGDRSLGNRVHIELQDPANTDAIYTVPSGKTFTGTIILVNAIAAGTLGVNAATGGSKASITGAGVDVVDGVTIAGGAGNALTAVVSGGAKGSVVIDGYVK